jgi:hypothetical protein
MLACFTSLYRFMDFFLTKCQWWCSQSFNWPNCSSCRRMALQKYWGHQNSKSADKSEYFFLSVSKQYVQCVHVSTTSRCGWTMSSSSPRPHSLRKPASNSPIPHWKIAGTGAWRSCAVSGWSWTRKTAMEGRSWWTVTAPWLSVSTTLHRAGAHALDFLGVHKVTVCIRYALRLHKVCIECGYQSILASPMHRRVPSWWKAWGGQSSCISRRSHSGCLLNERADEQADLRRSADCSLLCPGIVLCGYE